MEKKQSSIDWLKNQLKKRYYLMNSKPLFEQAKAMHKEEIEDAWRNGLIKGMDSPLPEKYYNESSQYYYNETFKGDNE